MTNPKPACRVVTQYLSGGEKVFELATADAPLELRVSSLGVGGGERRWHVAAQPGGAADSTVITGEGETKRGALSKVAEQWAERAAELGLPTLDWVAVEAALLAVRGV